MSELIHGIHAVAAALKYEPEMVLGVLVQRQRRDNRIKALMESAVGQGIPIRLVDRSELDRLSGSHRHQGVLASLAVLHHRRNEADLSTLLMSVPEPALLLVLDGIQDPHNLGACLRSAAAAGVHAVIAPANRAVGLNATVRKTACGAAEVVPFVTVSNLARTLISLREQGIWIIGADAEAEESLYQADFNLPTGIVLGSEGNGLRRLTYDVCDMVARIPISDRRVESLNVSVATGIFLFEARRQRGTKSGTVL